MTEQEQIDLRASLTEAQAYALAELCKRIGWSDVRSMAVDDDEARLMIQATDMVRSALDLVGVRVR
jgi:hypothetical protein